MANDTFTNSDGTALDTHSANWTYASPSTTVDFEINSNAARVINSKKWTNPVAIMNTAGDPDVSELVQLDLTNGASSGFSKPACRMSASSRGYNLSITENGTTITSVNLNRHTTSAVATTGAITVGDATAVDVAVTAEGSGATVTVRLYIDGTEITDGSFPYADTDASRITSGTGSGWLAYAAGTLSTDAVSEWRDVVGGGGGGDINVTGDITVSYTPGAAFDIEHNLNADIAVMIIAGATINLVQDHNFTGDITNTFSPSSVIEIDGDITLSGATNFSILPGAAITFDQFFPASNSVSLAPAATFALDIPGEFPAANTITLAPSATITIDYAFNARSEWRMFPNAYRAVSSSTSIAGKATQGSIASENIITEIT